MQTHKLGRSRAMCQLGAAASNACGKLKPRVRQRSQLVHRCSLLIFMYIPVHDMGCRQHQVCSKLVAARVSNWLPSDHGYQDAQKESTALVYDHAALNGVMAMMMTMG